VAQAFLKAMGVSVTLAEDGKLGLEIIENDASIDLVLMDLQMPVMDGLTASRQIRDREAASGQKHLPIIALTAGAFAEDRHKATQAGMDDFLTKPLELSDLQKVLGQWLPSIAPETTTPAKADQPVDIARIQELVARLILLLADNNFSLQSPDSGSFRRRQQEHASNRQSPPSRIRWSNSSSARHSRNCAGSRRQKTGGFHHDQGQTSHPGHR
jgi:CheY-like chemotaxis protein